MQENTRKQRFRQITKAVDQGYQSIVIELSRDYIRDYPDHWASWIYFARALAYCSRYDEAKYWYLKLAVVLEKSEPRLLDAAYSGLGHLCERRGNYRKASEWFEKAAAVDPQEASYLIFLGVAQYRLGKFEEAAAILERAAECEKGCIDEAFYNLAVVLASQSRYDEALTNFERALELDPTDKLARAGVKDVKQVLQYRKNTPAI